MGERSSPRMSAALNYCFRTVLTRFQSKASLDLNWASGFACQFSSQMNNPLMRAGHPLSPTTTTFDALSHFFIFFIMNIDTFPPQPTVTSRPLVPLPAKYLSESDVHGKSKLPAKYQSYYLPDAFFPIDGPPSPTVFNGRSSNVPRPQNLNRASHARQSWDTVRVMETAQPHLSSLPMAANPHSTPFFFQPPSNPPRLNPPTIYGRMTTSASRQRTLQACDSCRERKTKVRHLESRLDNHADSSVLCLVFWKAPCM